MAHPRRRAGPPNLVSRPREDRARLTYVVKGTDGNLYGPADEATLDQWAAQGRIVAGTELAEQGTNRLLLARDLPALVRHFGPAQGPAPHQPNPGSPYANPPAPSVYPRYGATPYSGPTAPKSKLAAALLAFFLGGFGIHRFYLGYTAIGVTMLVVTVLGWLVCCGIPSMAVGVWALVDFVMILTGSLKDSTGQPLV